MTPQARRDNLLDELRQRHDGFSPRLRQAARHILEHPNQAALSTVTALGAAAAVPPSALIRLAQALGFTGFAEMQAVLRAALAAAGPSYGERVQQMRDAGAAEGLPGLLRQASGLGQVSLQNLNRTVDAAALDRAAALLAAAPLVHVLGQRRSHPVAAYIAYGLTRAGRMARLLAGTAGMLQDEVRTMRPGDVLVVVSQPPYSPDSVDAAGWAARHGVAVVALTDGALSPFAPISNAMLEVQDAELFGFRALVAQMCLAQVLVLGTLRAIDAANPGGASPRAG